MSDDIVTRLRGKEHGGKDLRCEACDGFCCHCELCDCCIEIMEVSLESADEIERLRAEVARLTLVSSLWESEFVAAVDEIKRLGKS